MDKVIVRLSIILLTIYMAISLAFAWNGCLLYNCDSLFSCSLVCGVLLNVLVYSQGKYHCVYMRGLCANLIVTPTLNYLDGEYSIFEDAELMLIVLSSMWIISVTSTLILAFRHFYKVQKLKSDKNKLYEDRRRNDGKD